MTDCSLVRVGKKARGVWRHLASVEACGRILAEILEDIPNAVAVRLSSVPVCVGLMTPSKII